MTDCEAKKTLMFERCVRCPDRGLWHWARIGGDRHRFYPASLRDSVGHLQDALREFHQFVEWVRANHPTAIPEEGIFLEPIVARFLDSAIPGYDAPNEETP